MPISLAIGPRVRKSPFFEASRSAGLESASVYNRMYMPTGYGDAAAEYDRLINKVAMWDVSVERQVAIVGRNAKDLVKYLTPRNIDNIKIGQGRYVPICDFNGTVINDPVLLQISEDEYWLSIADSDIRLWAAGIGGAKNFDVEVYEPDVSPLAVQGPKAEDVIASLCGNWVRDLKYFGFRDFELNGVPVIVARSGWSKQGGFELYLLDSSKGTTLWNLVAEAGEPFGIGPGTPNYIERIESGLVSYGADTDEMTNPFELGLDRFMDIDQPHDFVGKTALQVIKREGVSRRFMGLMIDGAPFNGTNEHWWDLTSDGAYAGYACASAYSPRAQSNIAVAMVKTDVIDSGAQVNVHTETGNRTADVVQLPII